MVGLFHSVSHIIPVMHASCIIVMLVICQFSFTTWWLIPLSKWVITPVISGLTLLRPFITGVITHLLSGMSHQAVIISQYSPLLNPPIVSFQWRQWRWRLMPLTPSPGTSWTRKMAPGRWTTVSPLKLGDLTRENGDSQWVYGHSTSCWLLGFMVCLYIYIYIYVCVYVCV